MPDQDFVRIIFPCPNCRAKCQFKIVWQPSDAVLNRIHGHITRYVLQCTACSDFIFLRTRKVSESHPEYSTVSEQFPPPGITPHPSIPADVAVDLRDASLCLSIGAWNATAAMCRRALQSCAKDKKANPKDRLFDQLKELNDKAIIPEPVYNMAEAIRNKGNIGAHPGEDPIVNENVSKAEALAVFSIIEQVMKYVYEFPSEVAALKGQ